MGVFYSTKHMIMCCTECLNDFHFSLSIRIPEAQFIKSHLIDPNL